MNEALREHYRKVLEADAKESDRHNDNEYPTDLTPEQLDKLSTYARLSYGFRKLDENKK